MPCHQEKSILHDLCLRWKRSDSIAFHWFCPKALEQSRALGCHLSERLRTQRSKERETAVEMKQGVKPITKHWTALTLRGGCETSHHAVPKHCTALTLYGACGTYCHAIAKHCMVLTLRAACGTSCHAIANTAQHSPCMEPVGHPAMQLISHSV